MASFSSSSWLASWLGMSRTCHPTAARASVGRESFPMTSPDLSGTSRFIKILTHVVPLKRALQGLQGPLHRWGN